MNTQTLLDNVTTGTIKVLKDRSDDMGINWECLGQFEDKKELMKLLDEYYPWVLDDDEALEETNLLLEDGYIDLDAEEIDCFQIEDGNKLYVRYQDLGFVENLVDCFIYDSGKNNYLLGFSNTGWPYIDGAIDLETGTIGYYNDQENIYKPVAKLNEYDIETLSNVMEDFFFGENPDEMLTVNVKRKFEVDLV
ncbi:hypothetical protein [Limosilactobacillus vaginalis]|uniref:hypothetical protein n=1 Tax=Limosilactobacillus vaginalis TaxID=1633 RepID=UPI0025A35A05|nr:hypothetical protein [Limosilactobacillus vaginalis]MDM8265440.1 hypothetical protein [Limosilactobacillus vaginalis]